MFGRKSKRVQQLEREMERLRMECVERQHQFDQLMEMHAKLSKVSTGRGMALLDLEADVDSIDKISLSLD